MDQATDPVSEDERGRPVVRLPVEKIARPVRDGLGQVLRDAYRDAVDEGVPDDMLDLLRKLD